MNQTMDKSNMKQVLLDFPLQFSKALELTKDIKLTKKFNNLVVAGMGGSSLPANILATYLDLDLSLPLFITRNYSLPSQANKNSLVFTISFSGNTEETLAVYEQAKKAGMQIAAITPGGKLAETAAKDKTPLVKLPQEGIQPRSGTGYIFTAMLGALMNAGIIKNKRTDIFETIKKLQNFSSTDQAAAKKIAQQLKNRLIIVYASEKYSALARIWKIKFNENAKVLAFYNEFPELNHNETAGFSNLEQEKIPTTVIILRQPVKDNPRILKRMNITKEIIEDKGGEVLMIDIIGVNPLDELFSTLYLGDWISYYLALEYNTDPSPVEVVEYLKKRLKE